MGLICLRPKAELCCSGEGRGGEDMDLMWERRERKWGEGGDWERKGRESGRGGELGREGELGRKGKGQG